MPMIASTIKSNACQVMFKEPRTQVSSDGLQSTGELMAKQRPFIGLKDLSTSNHNPTVTGKIGATMWIHFSHHLYDAFWKPHKIPT
mmetsp:Transcript_17138/g.35202  ORF Transcript_17138/g.35202 Transcript_17138/m.35202 type:complete len:86 (+) Transcript_17138:743-1000(+)